MKTDEQRHLQTWIKEWRLLGAYSSELRGNDFTDVQLGDGRDWFVRVACFPHYPMETWVVGEPSRNLAKYGTFFYTLDEALDLASEMMRERL